jgi:hypothetical protein
VEWGERESDRHGHHSDLRSYRLQLRGEAVRVMKSAEVSLQVDAGSSECGGGPGWTLAVVDGAHDV